MGTTTNINSALVKVGNTSCVCGVTGLVGPRKAGQEELVSVKVDVTPLAGSTGPVAEVVQAQVEAFLFPRGAKVVPQGQLVIERGENPIYWHLQVDVYCIEDDGCVFDASLLACVSALKDTKLPALHLDPSSGRFVQSMSGPPTSLQLCNPPFAVTFALIGTYVVADPSSEEETLSDALIHVVWNSAGQLCAIDKPGGSKIARSELMRCVEQAKQRTKDFFDQWT